VLVVDDGLLDALHGLDDYLLNLEESLSDLLLAEPKKRCKMGLCEPRHKIELESLQVPFAAEFLVVVVRSFLDGYVGQMHVFAHHNPNPLKKLQVLVMSSIS
jgi:hypothetical protein